MSPNPKNNQNWVPCLIRGIRQRCPRCGQGRIFKGFYQQLVQCSHCELVYVKDAMDILAWMYISTALITGFFILGMFLIVPENKFWGRLLMGLIALVAILGTLPIRKGLAIAINYLINRSID